MGHVLENPFRTLGLPAESTEREILKRAQELDIHHELGKPWAGPLDLPWLPSISRTSENIRAAEALLHREEDRAFYSLLWLRQPTAEELHSFGGSTAPVALSTMAMPLADELTVSARQNLFVVHLALDEGQPRKSSDNISRAIAHFSILIHEIDNLLSSYRPSVRRAALDRLVQMLQGSALDGILGPQRNLEASPTNWKWLIDRFKGYPPPYSEWAGMKLEEVLRQRLGMLLHSCSAARKANPAEAHIPGLKLAQDGSNICKILSETLGTNSSIYILHADEIAIELLNCAIDYHNEWLDKPDDTKHLLQKAHPLLESAKSLSQTDHIKERIQTATKTIVAHSSEQARRIANRLTPGVSRSVPYETEFKPTREAKIRFWGCLAMPVTLLAVFLYINHADSVSNQPPQPTQISRQTGLDPSAEKPIKPKPTIPKIPVTVNNLGKILPNITKIMSGALRIIKHKEETSIKGGKLLIIDRLDSQTFSPLQNQIPNVLWPSEMKDIHYIAIIQKKAENIGRYSNGGIGYQWKYYLKLVNYKKKTIATQREFLGGEPPQNVRVKRGQMSDFYGSDPTPDMVRFLTNGVIHE